MLKNKVWIVESRRKGSARLTNPQEALLKNYYMDPMRFFRDNLRVIDIDGKGLVEFEPNPAQAALYDYIQRIQAFNVARQVMQVPDFWRDVKRTFFLDYEWDGTLRQIVDLAHKFKPSESKESGPGGPRHFAYRLQWAALKYDHLHTDPVRIIVGKSRRAGATTLFSMFDFWRTTMFGDNEAAIIAHDERAVKNIFRMVKRYHNNWPVDHKSSPFKPKEESNSQTFLQFNNGSILETFTAGGQDIRSFQKSIVHLSEFAHYKSMEAVTPMMIGLPPHCWVFKESTADGPQGPFYEDWGKALDVETVIDAYDAKDTNTLHKWDGYFRWFWSWLDDPRNVAPVEPWETKAILETLDDYEKALVKRGGDKVTVERLKWRRDKILRECSVGHLTPEQFFSQEFPCFVGGTRISTDKGIIPIEEAGTATRVTTGPIERTFANPPRDVFAVRTRDGRELVGTAEHPIAIPSGGFKPLGELVPGDRVVLHPPMFAEAPYRLTWADDKLTTTTLEVTPEVGRLLGYFMGDGSWYKGTIEICNDGQDADVVADVAALVEKFIAPAHMKLPRDRRRVPGWVTVRACARGIEPRLLRLGLLERAKAGHYKRKVHVPESIWRSPKPVVREFLRGLFESDGSATPVGLVRFGTSKLSFAREVQVLLLGFGITSTMSIRTNGILVCLRRDESDLFATEIGFISVRKRAKRLVARDPRGRWGRPIVMEDEVISVTPAGKAVTYNMTVGETHTYAANGVLTHNCDASELFQTSGGNPFPHEKLSVLKLRADAGIVRGHFRLHPFALPEKTVPSMANFIVYEPPRKGAKYIIGADVAQGLGGDRDYTAAAVFKRIDGVRKQQVAMFHTNIVSPADFGHILTFIAEYYNNAFVVPESMGPGAVTCRVMVEENRYTNVYKRENLSGLNYHEQDSFMWGFYTQAKSKDQLIEHAVFAVKHGHLDLRHAPSIEELRIFKYDQDRKRYEAPSGKHDDCVIAIALANFGDSPYRGAPPLAPVVAKEEESAVPAGERKRDEYQQALLDALARKVAAIERTAVVEPWWVA